MGLSTSKMTSSISEKLSVPAAGGSNSRRPKYSKDGGVLGFDHAEYNDSGGTVTAVFHFDSEAIRDSVVSENDVAVIE